MSVPWFKFYPTDWRSDPRLRMCSMAARGLWIEMIALMHEATPYGHLLVSGLSPTGAQLAVLAGAPSDQIPDLLGELEAAGVFSRTSAGVIYSRKMTRMAKKAALARKNGKSGGNPSLRKETVIPTSDNQQHKGRDKPQKPEARSQIEGGGGGAHARDTTRHERILAAIGVQDVTAKWHSPEAIAITDRWLSALSLTDILAEVEAIMRGRTGPPGTLRYFNDAMQRAVDRKANPPAPLRPVPLPEGQDHARQPPARPSRSTEGVEAFIAGARRLD